MNNAVADCFSHCCCILAFFLSIKTFFCFLPLQFPKRPRVLAIFQRLIKIELGVLVEDCDDALKCLESICSLSRSCSFCCYKKFQKSGWSFLSFSLHADYSHYETLKVPGSFRVSPLVLQVAQIAANDRNRKSMVPKQGLN